MGKITDEMTSGGGSPQRIQEEIRHTESEMSDTINEIEERLSPAHLKAEFFARVKRSVNSVMTQVRQTVKENPVPFTVLGFGVVILGTGAMAKASKKRRESKRENIAESSTQWGGLGSGEGLSEEQQGSVHLSPRPKFTRQDYLVGGAIGLFAGAVLAFMPKREPVVYGQPRIYGGPLEETGPLIK